jgi:hypothetical protein
MSGKMFYGSSPDGSDAKEFEGVYINPNNPNEWSNSPYLDEPFVLTNPYVGLENNNKQWVCKGLHQYKNVNGEWICQCGTKL